MPPTSMNNKGIMAPFRNGSLANALQLGMAMRQICQMGMLTIFLRPLDHFKKSFLTRFYPFCMWIHAHANFDMRMYSFQLLEYQMC